MGRCLAFNFGPSELKEKMKAMKYLVYLPDFDAGAGGHDQYFFTAIESSADEADKIISELKSALDLKTGEHGNFKLSTDANMRLVYVADERTLFISMDSIVDYGAITENHIQYAQEIDDHLSKMNLKIVDFTRYEDLVFGSNHLLAAKFAKPFVAKALVGVPLQAYWFVGRSFQEAQDKYNKWSKS